MRGFVSITLNIIAIVFCGGAGALAGYSVVAAVGLTGVFAALTATVIAMIIATLAWAIGAALVRAITRLPRFR